MNEKAGKTSGMALRKMGDGADSQYSGLGALDSIIKLA